MDTLRLHTLFLEKLEKLTDDERELFVEYLAKLDNPPAILPDKIDLLGSKPLFPQVFKRKSGQNQAESV